MKKCVKSVLALVLTLALLAALPVLAATDEAACVAWLMRLYQEKTQRDA